MRTSLNELRDIERYLHGEMRPDEIQNFRQEALPGRRLNIFLQRKIYSILRCYDRKKKKAEFETLHQHLFATIEQTEFQERVLNFFKN